MKRALKRILVHTLNIHILLATIVSLQCQSNPIQTRQTSGDAGADVESWFTMRQVAERVWRISDHGNDNMYLVEGKDRALLIDTGLGVSNLSGFVKSITSLPVIVVNTHGHTDHAGGNYHFKTIYAHPAELESIRQFSSKEYRRKMAQNILKATASAGASLPDDGEDSPPATMTPVQEGYMFDLGDRKLEVIEVPGHTLGSICILDSVHKILFSGDNDNQLVWLFLKSCAPLETYLQSLKKLSQRIGQFDIIMPGHGSPLKSDFVSEQIACAQNILDGTCRGQPYKSPAGNALVCRYRSASIAFDPNNLHVQK